MSFFNWFLDPVKNHYADFSGRASRKAYWMFVLVYVIIAVIIGIAESFLATNFVGLIFAVLIFVPSIAIAARRLHDTGMSGWWQLVALIPFIGGIALVILLVRKSQDGDNKYGAHPYGVAAPASNTPTGVPPTQ